MKILITDRNSAEEMLQLAEFSQLYPRLVDDLKIDALCGVCCSCATCHVYLSASQFNRVLPPAADELDVLEGLINTKETSGLLCQLRLKERTECDKEGAPLSITLAPEE